MSEFKLRDRIFVEQRTIEIYKSLNASATKNSSINDQPFAEAKEIFMWAVALGVYDGKRQPLKGSKEGLFFWNRLSAEFELPILRLIAIAETNNVETANDEAYIQNMAEEFANCGIRKMNDILIKQGGGPLFNLIDFVRRQENNLS